MYYVYFVQTYDLKIQKHRNFKFYKKSHQRKELRSANVVISERTNVFVSSFHVEDSQTGSSGFSRSFSIGCQGDVSAEAINISHMCLLRNVCFNRNAKTLKNTHS